MNTREEFGKYLLLKKLAEDPLGESFRAGRLGQQGLEQVVLLRVFNGQGLDSEGLWKILSGRQGLQSALKSPNIGSGVDAGRVRGVPYVAYDYISGKDLATLISQASRETSPFPTDHALLIADRIGLALTAAYEARHGGDRVLHGMVVPQLTMVSNEGETRLLGFEAGPGLAAKAGSLPEAIQRYLAPEVRNGGAPTKTSDVFSLGAILLELLTGRAAPLTTSEGYGTLIDQARLAAEGTPLPAPVATLLKRSLAPAADRISDAPSWHKLLSKVMSEGGYNATTFNLAFFMHNLFREEIERESREIEAEKTLEVPMSQISSVASGGAATMAVPREVADKASPTAAPADDTAAVRARYGLEGAASEESAGGSKKGLWIAVAAAVVIAVAAGLYFTVFAPKSGQPAAAPPMPAAQAQMPVAEVQQEEPPAPPTPDPAELQAQIDKMVEEKTQAMEASLKEQYDKKITDMQHQLQDAQEAAAERARREEEAKKAADEARKKAAAEEAAQAKAPAETVSEPAEAAGMAEQDQATGQGAPGATTPARQGQATPPRQPAPQPKPAPAQPEVRVGELVQGGAGVVPPRVVRRATPEFPPVAARLHKTATVDVRVLVDENGNVADAEVDGRKVGFGFDQAALAAARTSTYEAATKYGVKVKMWVTVRFVFGR